MSLTAKLARLAAKDAGLARDEIDGLLVTTPFGGYSCFWPSSVADHLNLNLRYFDTVDLGGASSAAMDVRAAAAIHAGLCDHVLCVAADVALRTGSIYSAIEPPRDAEFEQPYGASPPNAGYAMIARRHMYEFGTTSRQLAKIAVDQRANALANPDALFSQAPLTIDEVLKSKLIFDPLHLFRNRLALLRRRRRRCSRRSAAGRGSHAPVNLARLVAKLEGCDLKHEIDAFAIDALGELGLLYDGSPRVRMHGSWQTRYMLDLGFIIGGGTAHIQKNIIAERGLDMPREPKLAKG